MANLIISRAITCSSKNGLVLFKTKNQHIFVIPSHVDTVFSEEGTSPLPPPPTNVVTIEPTEH